MSPAVVIWGVCFVLLLVLKCVAGQWLHARASGWTRLSQRYPHDGACTSKRFERAIIRVRAHWYHQTPIVGVDGSGIRLAMRRAFRPFHPPVFIPWDDITSQGLGNDGNLQLIVGESSQLTLTGPAARATSGLLARRAHGTSQWSA